VIYIYDTCIVAIPQFIRAKYTHDVWVLVNMYMCYVTMKIKNIETNSIVLLSVQKQATAWLLDIEYNVLHKHSKYWRSTHNTVLKEIQYGCHGNHQYVIVTFLEFISTQYRFTTCRYLWTILNMPAKCLNLVMGATNWFQNGIFIKGDLSMAVEMRT